MKIRFLVPFIAIAGCALPERRPDPELVLASCDTNTELSTNLSNMDCIRLDARTSSGSGLRFRWEWSLDGATWTLVDPASHIGTRASCPPAVPANAEQLCARPFEALVGGETSVSLRVIATDSSGHDGAEVRALKVARVAPIIGAAPIAYRARAVDMVLNPFLVIEPEIQNPNASDYHVRVLPQGPEGKPLRGSLCADVLARTGVFGDPSGKPHAWCFDLVPIDDIRTPQNEALEYVYAPFLDTETTRFVFRVDAIEPSLANDAAPLDADPCVPRTDSFESATCVTSVYSDVVWTGAGSQISGRVGRYAGDWLRVPLPNNVAIRDGFGMANHDGRTWFAGATFVPACDFSSCEGIVNGLADDLGQELITGVGIVRQLKSGPGMLWVDHIASSNPRGTPAAVVTSGDHHVFVIQNAGLAQRDLVSQPAADLRHLVGFGSYTINGNDVSISAGQEVPTDMIATANGDLWLLTLAGPAADLRVRRIPFAAVAGGSADVRTLPPLVLDPPVGGTISPVATLPFPAIARAASGGVVYAERVPATADVRIRFLSPAGAQVSSFTVPNIYIFGMAYDPAADAVWLTDVARSAVHRIEGASQLSGVVDVDLDPAVDSTGPVTFPGSLAIDQYGGLWVDDRIDNFARRPVYIGPPSANGELPAPLELDDYTSFGIGILPSNEAARGAWRADLADIVRAPLFSPVEVPVSAVLPAQPKLVGVDTIDGSAYYVATVGGPNFFRVEANGVVHELGALADLPFAGALVPDLSRRLASSTGIGVRRGSIFLGVQSPDLTNSVIEIPLAPLRRLAEGETLPSPLPACPVPLPDLPPPCLKSRLQMPSGYPSIELVTDIGDASVLVYSTMGPAQEIGSIVLGDLFDSALAPLVGPNAVSTTGGLAMADDGRVMSSLIGGSGDNFYGGVLVRMPDGTATRWRITGANLGPDPDFKVPSPFPAMAIRAARVDPVHDSVWLALDDGTSGQSAIWRATATFTPGSPLVLTSATTIGVAHDVAGADAAPFSGTLWTSGTDGFVARIRHVPADNSLRVEYLRPPDYLGALGPTPSGSHIFAGSF